MLQLLKCPGYTIVVTEHRSAVHVADADRRPTRPPSVSLKFVSLTVRMIWRTSVSINGRPGDLDF